MAAPVPTPDSSPARRRPVAVVGRLGQVSPAMTTMRIHRHRLRVDPIACDAFGYCAELLPELVHLDEWGYPIIAQGAIPPQLLDLAIEAVRQCPRRAMFLETFEA